MSTPAAVRFYSLPDCADWIELLRPWKLFTFAVAMALLLYGALMLHIGDWDVGITLIMGGLTYVFAPLAIRAFVNAVRHPGGRSALDVLLALLLAWWTIDGVYVAYHTLVGNPIYRASPSARSHHRVGLHCAGAT